MIFSRRPITLLAACLLALASNAFSAENPTTTPAAPCVFCAIAEKKIPAPIIYEDDLAVAFMDRAPRNPGHVLVIPRAHSVDFLDAPPATIAHLAIVAQKIATAIKHTDLVAEGFNFMSNTGTAAGQSVFHLHLHLIPRFKTEPPGTAAGEKAIVPPAELEAVAAKIRAALATSAP